MKKVRLAAFLMLVSLPVGTIAHEGHDHDTSPDRQYKVGKTGEVNLREDTALGELVLKKGKYTVVHAANSDRHSFTFLPATKKGTPSETFKPIEANSKTLVPLRGTAVNFVVFAVPDNAPRVRGRADYRIVKITVNDERWEHLF
jgi:hypothetical protein